MKFVVFFIVFYLFIILAQYWQLIKLLLLNPIHKYRFAICSADEIPKSMRKQLQAAVFEFKNLGFKTIFFQKHDEIYFNINRPKYSAVLWHPETNVYVSVVNPITPDAIQPFHSTFLSFYNSKIIQGFYSEAYGIVEGFDGFHCIDQPDTNLENRFNSFIQYIEAYEEENSIGNRLKISPTSYIDRNNKATSDYIDYLEQIQVVKPNKNGAYSFNFLPAIKFAAKIKDGAAKTAKKETESIDLLQHHPDYLVAPEVDAYYRLDKIVNHNTFNKWVKTILFILSVLAFSLLFGSFFSYSFVLFLLPVLFFHELGHYLAMKLFGYYDLQILFMPFGAAVLGKEKDISVLKKVIVSLAGPVPGIIVALMIGWLAPESLESGWVYELTLMLLIINYFNLLPFMPLDGGQIINQVLLGRYPIAQFVFSVISVAAFAFFAYYFQDHIITTISIFLALGLIAQFSNTKLLYKLRNITFSNKTNLLAQLFSQLASQPLRFQQKFQLIQAVLPSLLQAKAKFYEIVLGLLLYFSALFAPLYVINDYTNGALLMVSKFQINNDVDYESFDDEQWSEKYWKEKIQNADSVNKKFGIYIELINYMESDDLFYEFESLIKEGLAFAKTNSFQDHKDYPLLLQTNIVLPYWVSDDISKINFDLLDELKQIDEGQNLQYARALLDLFSYQYDISALENLLTAKSIFQSLNSTNYLNRARYSLVDYYEQAKEFDKAESLLIELSKDDKNFDYNSFATHYFKRKDFKQSVTFCEKQLSINKPKEDISTDTSLNTCAWFAVFAENYQKAEIYFLQAYKVQQQNVSEIKSVYLSVGQSDIYDQVKQSYDFQYNLDLMTLYWAKGELVKAKDQFVKLKSLDDESEYISLDSRINLFKDMTGANSPLLEMKAQLVLNAYENLNID